MLEEIDSFRIAKEHIVSVLSVGPNGAIAGTWPGTVAFRDFKRKTTHTNTIRNAQHVMGLAGPTSRGKIVVAGYDGMLYPTSIQELAFGSAIRLSDIPLSCAANSSDGSVLAIGGRSEEVFLLRGTDLSILARLSGHDGWVESIVLCTDQNTLFTGTQAGTVHVWDLAQRRRRQTFHAHDGAVMCLAISRDGRTLVSGGQDNLIKSWSISEPISFRTSLSGHDATVRGVGFLQNPINILSISQDRTIRIWQLDSGREIHRRVTDDEWLTSLAIASDRLTVVIGSLTGVVRVWQIRS